MGVWGGVCVCVGGRECVSELELCVWGGVCVCVYIYTNM